MREIEGLTIMGDGAAAAALRLMTVGAIFVERAKEAHTLIAGRKRRRSGSPYERERYDPRPRYEDYGASSIVFACYQRD